MSSSSRSDSLAIFLGGVISVGSLTLYAPQIIRLVRLLRSKPVLGHDRRDSKPTVSGPALSTFLLKLSGYSLSVWYNYIKKHPMDTYTENLCMIFQVAVCVLLILALNASTYYLLSVQIFGFLIASTAPWMFVFVFNDMFVPAIVDTMQLLAAVLGFGAIPVQLAQNQRLRTSGDYSIVTASLATLGCIVRTFTTIVRTDDSLMLVSFVVGTFLNGLLVYQIIYFGRKEGRSFKAIFTSDVQ